MRSFLAWENSQYKTINIWCITKVAVTLKSFHAEKCKTSGKTSEKPTRFFLGWKIILGNIKRVMIGISGGQSFGSKPVYPKLCRKGQKLSFFFRLDLKKLMTLNNYKFENSQGYRTDQMIKKDRKRSKRVQNWPLKIRHCFKLKWKILKCLKKILIGRKVLYWVWGFIPRKPPLSTPLSRFMILKCSRKAELQHLTKKLDLKF